MSEKSVAQKKKLALQNMRPHGVGAAIINWYLLLTDIQFAATAIFYSFLYCNYL
jgi:hypothetical protein